MKINETLRNKRIELGLSQTAVAKYLKIPQSSLCRYEQGQKMTNKELITHKLVEFYKGDYMNVKPVSEVNKRKLTQNTHKPKVKTDSFVSKFEKIYNEELEKLNQDIRKKAMKKAMKRFCKEM